MRTARAKSVICLVAVAVWGAFSGDAPAAQWTSVKPEESAGTVEIRVDSKTLRYHSFDCRNALSFLIEGPLKVKVLTRLRMAEDAGEAPYRIIINRDGVRTQTVEVATSRSGRAGHIGLAGFSPGAIRRIFIDVPSGFHTYRMSSVGGAVVDARVFTSPDAAVGLASVAPMEHAGAEILCYKDKELTYYRLTRESPAVLEVTGPMSVKVNARLLFDAVMSDKQAFVLGVSERGKIEQFYKIETVPSKTVVCRDRRERTPGALRSFTLEVESGVHVYDLRLVEARSDELLIKLYIPRGVLADEL